MSKTPREQIEAEIKSAMKARDSARLGTLRLLLTSIKNEAIAKGEEVDEKAFIGIVRKAIKQRNESLTQFREAGRDEQAAKEEAEIEVLEAYMPQQASESEIRSAVEALIAEQGLEGPKAMGAVMKAMMAKFGGNADGSVISRIAKELLSG